MPWETPTLRGVRSLVRDNLRANLLGADALIPNSVLRVMSDDQAALCHLTLQYLDWLSLQIMPDTAETEWLDRYASIWLTNADGSTGRKLAQLSSGFVTMTANIPWSVIPIGTRLGYGISGGQIEFETIESIHLSSVGTPIRVPLRALDAGVVGNVPAGASLGLYTTIRGIDARAIVVSLDGGVDDETDNDLRYRLLHRIRQPPHGGAAHDYEQWALAVAGVTRAWVAPNEMGAGTITVRVMMDQLRANRDGYPTQDDLTNVRAYLDRMRPVAVKDLFVEAPIPQRIDIVINNLQPDNSTIRSGIDESLRRMIHDRSSPGQTIFSVWKTQAIMNSPGVHSFDLVGCDREDFMPSAGHLAILGSIIYAGRGSNIQLAAPEAEPEEPPYEPPEEGETDPDIDPELSQLRNRWGIRPRYIGAVRGVMTAIETADGSPDVAVEPTPPGIEFGETIHTIAIRWSAWGITPRFDHA